MAKREDAFIETIRSIFAPAQISVGIGDDGAVFECHGNLVITTDMLVEGVDFFYDTPLRLAGHKALAANLSDLAAMGARPTSFLLTIATPPERLDSLTPLLEGMSALARRAGATLIGGDLSSSPVLTVSITAMGRPSVIEPLLRSAACRGDRLFLSRPIGGSAAGLSLYRSGWRLGDDGGAIPPADAAAPSGTTRDVAATMLRQHLAPDPETDLGVALGVIDKVHACIDVSDGLSTDLHRICAASGVGAVIDWDRIPVFEGLEESARLFGLTPENAVLHGGEEYALLFTSPLTEYQLSHLLGRSVYAIGRVDSAPGVRLNREGHEVSLGDYGWDHFEESTTQS